MPKAFDALLAEIVPVRSASSALLSESSFQVFVGPSFLGVSEERVNTSLVRANQEIQNVTWV